MKTRKVFFKRNPAIDRLIGQGLGIIWRIGFINNFQKYNNVTKLFCAFQKKRMAKDACFLSHTLFTCAQEEVIGHLNRETKKE
ncbi:hypothetical protein IM774_08665 [Erysipelotrichaceae bacterium RD49]|nr:hypothetical protein [Erysipelotrichaceae bacterium RD49]